ncbi:hypothetical protein ABRP92_04015 [Pectobacterium aroidearum]|uniref:hypothetical protein n=1 Tax=Pectobacterium aroidearum TaxID=1201031 RepID=UPI0032F07B9C
MSVYVITWNLNKERQNYDSARRAFIQHLERYDNIHDNGLESVRWINASATADQVYNDLKTKIDNNDRLFISQISVGKHQGWLSQQVWDWINSRL